MPCRYVIDKERRIVITTAWDRVSFAEVKEHQDQLKIDPEFDPEFRHLIDATKVKGIDASIDQIRAIAKLGLFSSTSRRAIVAGSPEIFAFGRVLGAYLELARKPQQVHVFYDMPAALKWLGLEADPRQS